MNTKRIVALLATVALTMNLAACGGSKPASSEPSGAPAASSAASSSASATPADSTEKVKLVWGGGASTNTSTARSEIVKGFNASQDKIVVELAELPTDATAQHDTYVTSFAAGANDYDLFQSNVPWPAEFSQAGYALAVDRFAERDGISFDDYFQGYVDAYTFQGQMWGIPTFGNVAILYYRNDIVETPPKTWEELTTMAKDGMGKNGTKYGYLIQAAQYEGLTCNVTDMIAAYGGEVTDGDGKVVVDNPGTVAALNVMRTFVDEGILPSDVTTHKEANSADLFLAGEAVFMRNWPAQWLSVNDPEKSKVVDKVSFCALPAGSERSAAVLGGWGNMIYSGTKHPEEAWEFLKYVAGPQGQKMFAIYDKQMPTLNALYQDPEVIAASPVFEGIAEAAATAVKRPVSPIYNQISEIMQIEVSAVLTGAQTPEQAAKNMQTNMDKAVAGNK